MTPTGSTNNMVPRGTTQNKASGRMCLNCGAKPHEPCVTVTGVTMSLHHQARRAQPKRRRQR